MKELYDKYYLLYWESRKIYNKKLSETKIDYILENYLDDVELYEIIIDKLNKYISKEYSFEQLDIEIKHLTKMAVYRERYWDVDVFIDLLIEVREAEKNEKK